MLQYDTILKVCFNEIEPGVPKCTIKAYFFIIMCKWLLFTYLFEPALKIMVLIT